MSFFTHDCVYTTLKNHNKTRCVSTACHVTLCFFVLFFLLGAALVSRDDGMGMMESTVKMRAVLGAERSAVGSLDRTLVFVISAVCLPVREQLVTDSEKKKMKGNNEHLDACVEKFRGGQIEFTCSAFCVYSLFASRA